MNINKKLLCSTSWYNFYSFPQDTKYFLNLAGNFNHLKAVLSSLVVLANSDLAYVPNTLFLSMTALKSWMVIWFISSSCVGLLSSIPQQWGGGGSNFPPVSGSNFANCLISSCFKIENHCSRLVIFFFEGSKFVVLIWS